MCFSFAASINASLSLAVIGGATVYKAARNDPRMLGFAVFPLVFAIHQAVEAVVWRSVAHPFPGDEIFRYLYTGIAFLVWPVLTPFAAAYAETDPFRRRLWTQMLYVGEALALYLFIKLALADGIDLTVYEHALAYDPGFERPPLLAHFLYVALTVVPLVCFNNRALRLFGVLVFLSFIYALANNRPAWYSLWCMSAAVFSFILAFAIKESAKSSVDQKVRA
ncbi:DUF6629 family protein [Methylocystis bryophila]|uniref:Uncharacterized protein n=1 Tax=Methylocystis bryophila TaxID=655015 RepID=A0A1W6MYQ4_9HYPH|nr:DUF6629 family protein [Methylocystis bryophila]ARN82720.1 hypothetical protein B1812_18310 [Methylocystis bryophila]BDV38951.1 hypothetical protein DSM21852_22040 [Methylocystis bryophila]